MDNKPKNTADGGVWECLIRAWSFVFACPVFASRAGDGLVSRLSKQSHGGPWGMRHRGVRLCAIARDGFDPVRAAEHKQSQNNVFFDNAAKQRLRWWTGPPGTGPESTTPPPKQSIVSEPLRRAQSPA